jgi:hypothetical protein
MLDTLFLQVIGGAFLLLYRVRITGRGFELAFGERLTGWWAAPGRSPERPSGRLPGRSSGWRTRWKSRVRPGSRAD